ncbi:MAG: SulP family inorganic anion transporter, partial [Anaerolineae bacterium]
APPPLFDLELIGHLSTGALAVGVIGLVEAMSIARSIAGQTGQRLDSNQEFVGQGLANVACGFLSGYTGSGSFTRSAVNYKAGGQTPLASVFSGLFVLIVMTALAPLAAYVPRTALAGVLIFTAYGMVDRKEIMRIWRGTRGDTIIMVATLSATLLLPLQFAVLTGVLFSFARYIMKTSMPRVYAVRPDDNFKHFVQQQPHQSSCPQLGIIKISGDLYFGAVSNVEETIHQHLANHPNQRFLLLRMQGVNQCDFSGIHMLEAILRSCREQRGDLFLMKVQEPVHAFMKSTGFYDRLGAGHFLVEDYAIEHLFYKVLDPAICIYECNVRVFAECQNLPKRAYPADIPLYTTIPANSVASVSSEALWQKLHSDTPPMVIDVREPREFKQGHIPQAQLVPLSKLLSNPLKFPNDRSVVFVCRSGRRSTRAAAYILQNNGCDYLQILQGGMLAWEAAGLLEAVE